MNEYAGEVNYTLEQYRKRPVEYLEELGLWAHILWLLMESCFRRGNKSFWRRQAPRWCTALSATAEKEFPIRRGFWSAVSA